LTSIGRQALYEPKRSYRAGIMNSLRPLIIIIAAVVLAVPAQSRSLQVVGSAGYLSEWELDGTVTEKVSAAGSEFFGPLTWRHVGLCSVNGPLEKFGEITFRLSGIKASHIDAIILMDRSQCFYSGDLSGSSAGHMDCSNAKGVPLSISVK
jgi:hypothetical protein